MTDYLVDNFKSYYPSGQSRIYAHVFPVDEGDGPVETLCSGVTKTVNRNEFPDRETADGLMELVQRAKQGELERRVCPECLREAGIDRELISEMSEEKD